MKIQYLIISLFIIPALLSTSSAIAQSTFDGNLSIAQDKDVIDDNRNSKPIRRSQFLFSDQFIFNLDFSFSPPNQPLINLAENVGGRLEWQETSNFADPRPSRAPGDCNVDFDDPADLDQLDEASLLNTFVMEPWWHQQCDSDNNVFIRPYKINHFHLLPENSNCFGSGPGEYQEDGSCQVYEDQRQQPHFLRTMLPNDVIELTVNDNLDNQKAFDFKRIRIMGKNAVRVCYKPAQEIDGPWLTLAQDGLSSPGTWACWNNMTPGYWDVSQWAGNVTAVRLIGAEGIPNNFAVDDIRIGVH